MALAVPLIESVLPEIIGGTVTAGVGYGLSKLTQPGAPHISVPPPPGAAMVDPAGSAAAAAARRRQATAGGLDSTITGAGMAPQAATAASGPTAGGKQLLGS